MLSHENALTFIGWCDSALGPWYDDDRFASHAPFHFDLSVFDLFAACRNRATLVLVGESLGKDPAALGKFIAKERISVWYSAPTILSLLAQNGGLPPPERDRAAAGAIRGRGLSDRGAQAAARCLAEGRDVEPLRPDRDQRVHRVSDPSDDSGRVASSRSRSARSALRFGHAWLTSRAATCRQALWASW